MLEDIDKAIFSSPHDIYFERLDKNLRQFLEDKAGQIRRAGKDILVELDPGNVSSVLTELKNNPELSFVDGKQNVDVSYVMQADSVELYDD